MYSSSTTRLPSAFSAIPKELRRILTSPDIKKGGVALANDLLVIWDDLRIKPRKMVDIGYVASLALAERYPKSSYSNMSLKNSVEDILGFTIDKDLGKSNWAAKNLTEEQIQCKAPRVASKEAADEPTDAALSAMASFRLVEVLDPELERRSVEISAEISEWWYTFNSRMGEPTRTKLSVAGEVVSWRTSDCTWYAGGKFIGYP